MQLWRKTSLFLIFLLQVYLSLPHTLSKGLSLPFTILTTLLHTSFSLFWPEVTQICRNILSEASSVPHITCTTKILPFLKISLPDISQNHINPFQGNVIFQQKGKENVKQKREMLKRKKWKHPEEQQTILEGGEKKKNQAPCKSKDIISFVEKVIQRNNGKSESWGKAHLYKITAL